MSFFDAGPSSPVLGPLRPAKARFRGLDGEVGTGWSEEMAGGWKENGESYPAGDDGGMSESKALVAVDPNW